MPKQHQLHQLIVVSINPDGTPSPWIIDGPISPSNFYEARKRGTTLLLTIHLKSISRFKCQIVLSQVIIRKTVKAAGPLDRGYTTEEWHFSALALVGRRLISSRIQGRLYFEGKKLTGEIIAAIPLPKKYVRII